MSTDSIRLTGLSARGFHGVLPSERAEGQEFVVDVEVWLDTRRAAATDDLALTVDYGTLAEHVVEAVGQGPYDLVETLAEHVAALALEEPAVREVEVTVHKPSAPITVPFLDVTVTVRRSRSHLPSVSVHPDPTASDLPEVPGLEPDEPREVVELDEPLLTPPVAVFGTGSVQVGDLPPVPQPTGAAAVVPTPVPDRFDDVPAVPVPVVLALGSNLGDGPETLRRAVAALASLPGLTVTGVAPLARTAPVGGPAGQPDYSNTVVLAVTTLSPRALLRAVQSVELLHGRERSERWGARTLDVDIVVFGDLVGSSDDLEIPHPRAHQRAFVLLPWAHIDPAAVLPGLGGGPVAALAETAPDRDGVRTLALDWLVDAVVRTGASGPGDSTP